MLPPVRAPQPERDRRWQRDAYGFGSLPEKKGGNPAVCFLIFMSIRMSQCPPPGKREPLGYTGPEAKGAGRPSPWTTDRQICPPDKLHHDQRKKWGRPCRYHAEGSLPQECPYPSAYRGCASFSFLRHCIILKKAVAFRHRAHPGRKASAHGETTCHLY